MKTKLLVVNKQNPEKSCYRNPLTIGSFLLSRRLDNYILIAVNSDFERVFNFNTSDVSLIQSHIKDYFTLMNS